MAKRPVFKEPIPVQESSTINQELICPICMEIPEQEVYQCKDGHFLCHQCYQKVRNCPQCRIELSPPIRSRAIESLIGLLPASCPYRKYGCRITTSRNKISNHEKECRYSGNLIELCLQIGINCSEYTYVLEPAATVNHFIKNHKAILIEKSCIELELKGFLSSIKAFASQERSENTKDGFWNPVVARTDGDVFVLIMAFLNVKENSLAFTFTQLNQDSGGATKQIAVQIDSNNDKAPVLQWEISATSILQSEEVLHHTPHQIPVTLLETNYVQLETDKLSVKLVFDGQSGLPLKIVGLDQINERIDNRFHAKIGIKLKSENS